MRTKTVWVVGLAIIIAIMMASIPVKAEIVELGAFEHFYLHRSLSSGDTWNIQFQAEDINVIVMDEGNYIAYANGNTYYHYTQYSANSVSSYSRSLTELDGTIYVVIESNNLLLPQTVSYTEELVSGIPGFELPLIITATVIGMAAVTITRRKRC